ncbi:hypothetical protein M9H77_08015 [Catharanthus roseus]|uniref:Uncharacterized protein n=1 Tax=Catharanthus roseus TaxID=4058 RepID=A0ACC0BWM5_CATRO|nr:hypothetical protein M9H77_08015 [Catharanthus roseus]
MESSMGEMSTKANEFSQAQDVIDRKVIHHEKKNICTFVKEEKSREEKVKSVELKLFIELYTSYVTLIGNVMDNPFTCDLAFDTGHMLKCSSPCAYLEKQLLEFIWLPICGKKVDSSFEVLKVHRRDFVTTTFENSTFELRLKQLDEKLVYPISFIDYLLKRDILKDFLAQNTTSYVKLLNQSFDGIFLYPLTFKVFLVELISLFYCKEELGRLSLLKEIDINVI